MRNFERMVKLESFDEKSQQSPLKQEEILAKALSLVSKDPKCAIDLLLPTLKSIESPNSKGLSLKEKPPTSTIYLSNVLNTLAVCYRGTLKYKESLQCLCKVIEMNKLKGDLMVVGICYRNVSQVLLEMGRVTDSLVWAKKAVKMFEKIEEKQTGNTMLNREKLFSIVNVADSFFVIEDWDLALKYYEKSIEFTNKISSEAGLDQAFINRLAESRKISVQKIKENKKPKVDKLDQILIRNSFGIYNPKPQTIKKPDADLYLETSESSGARSIVNPYSTTNKNKIIRQRKNGASKVTDNKSYAISFSKRIDQKNVELANSLNQKLGQSFETYLFTRPRSANPAKNVTLMKGRPISAAADSRTNDNRLNDEGNKEIMATKLNWRVMNRPQPKVRYELKNNRENSDNSLHGESQKKNRTHQAFGISIRETTNKGPES